MKWTYIGNKGITGMEAYSCSKCHCIIHVEKGSGLPRECPNCGGKDEEEFTEVNWTLTKDDLPTKSGEYLCWINTGRTSYGTELHYSAVHKSFNCRDYDKDPRNIMEVAAWAYRPRGPIIEEVEHE